MTYYICSVLLMATLLLYEAMGKSELYLQMVGNSRSASVTGHMTT